MFPDKTIEKRVMSLVRTAVKTAQENYEREVEIEDVNLEQEIMIAQEKHDTNVLKLADKGVKDVFAFLNK